MKWLASIPILTLLLSIFALLLLAFLGYLLYLLGRFWRSLNNLEIKDRFGIKNEVTKTIAQILGGALLLVGLYFTWANLMSAQEKNVTELYIKAVEQLGSDKMEVRLGGIYALERIARDSKKDYWTVMQVLTAYIRVHAKCEEEQLNMEELVYHKMSPDIEAVLAVFRRRKQRFDYGEFERLDLSRTNLCRSNFKDAHLEMAIFFKANLQRALLRKAQMKGSMLGNANLKGARMEEANLSQSYLVRANLCDAQLRGAILNGANLNGAKLWGTDLEDAELKKANLKRASLIGANLKEAKLSGAILEKSDLTKANLSGADLRNVIGLTKDQVYSAISDYNTQLPDYLLKPQTDRSESK